MGTDGLRVRADVAEALASGRPVVALESTIIAHGLPRPRNLAVARELEEIVAGEGAVPATIGVLSGIATVGLDEAQLELIATRDGVVKLGVRDLAVAMAKRVDGATTVAATAALAARAGIDVFATGGLGGVHREARETWDESADLRGLASTPIVVVCAGVKSILDVPATLERLESLSVSIVGYRTDRFPGFYLSDAGIGVDWSVAEPEEVADILEAQHRVGACRGAVVVANPLPPAEQLDPQVHDRVLSEGLRLAADRGIRGRAVTPFLLAHFHEATAGASLDVNVAIVRRNARLAAQIAAALAARSGRLRSPVSERPDHELHAPSGGHRTGPAAPLPLLP